VLLFKRNPRKIKRLLLLFGLLSILVLAGCNQSPSEPPARPTFTPLQAKAVYLSSGPGELTAGDLTAHPEVIRVMTFDQFKSHAASRIALLVDKNAVHLVDNQWLNSPPQKYYPLVIVGYNDPLYCFRDTFSVGSISGPFVDWNNEILEPGYCVWMIRVQTGTETSAFFRGYNQKPDLQDILDITNPLLEETQEIQIDR
jgi:hypothetical protein